MAISFIAQNRAEGNTSALTLAEPTGTASGDLVLVFGSQFSTARTITAPAGYDLLHKEEYTSFGVWVHYAWRGGTALGSSWSSTTDNQMTLFALTYRGVDTIVPILDWEFNTGVSSPGTWLSLDTTDSPNAWYVGGIHADSHLTPGTSSQLDNLRSGTSGSHYAFGYDETIVSPGATGTFTVTFPESATWYTVGVALAEAGPTPVLTQEGFRWRADDGSETTATWLAAQDSNP